MMSEHWKLFVEQYQHYIPFVCIAGNRVELDWSAIIQGLLVAAATTVGTTWIMTARLDERMIALRDTQSRLEHTQKALDDKLARMSEEHSSIRERIVKVEVQAGMTSGQSRQR